MMRNRNFYIFKRLLIIGCQEALLESIIGYMNFCRNQIDPTKDVNRENTKIEKYIELSKIRNAIVHYSKKDFYRVYGQDIERFSVEAPEIIDNLFTEYSSIFSQIPEARWFKNRKSRIIE
ncbi:hypothetical protein D3C73_1241240 [compost metagenome]